MQPSLFGIQRSNRNFADPYYWGKNQFNSAFPVALACYMRERGIPLVYIKFRDEISTEVTELSASDVLGSDKKSSDLFFSFETRFDAFRNYAHDDIPVIDLVVCDTTRESQIRPLEIKLTTLPDNTTERLDEHNYGAEIVIRSATTRYMALSMAQAIADQRERVRAIFEPVFAILRDWDSKEVMHRLAPRALAALEVFLCEFRDRQRPLLIQPLWKTKGKSPELADYCLDIFVWSDFALTHLFLDSARAASTGNGITRQLRAALRLSRFLYEFSRSGIVHQAPIYDGMTYDLQNDKEFAISGTKSRRLMACDRLKNLAIKKDEIKNIILGGGHKHLSPERRFDAILYFSTDLFESD